MVFPGAALLITVLAFNLVGDGLQDALHPKVGEHLRQRSQEEVVMRSTSERKQMRKQAEVVGASPRR